MTGDGGGIDQAFGTLSLSNVTLASNSAGNGGNLFNTGTVSAKNTIIAGGTASSGSENCAGSSAPVIASQGYNIEDRNQCGLSGPGDQTNTDPLLGGLQDNGGQTDTRALAVGSPAVNHGNPHGCTDASATLLMVDQRGMTRPEGLACDVGAYELQPVAPGASAFPATGIRNASATLNGAVETHGFQTSWQFDYGLKIAYGSLTPAQTIGGGTRPVHATISGLLPGTTYHFTLIASTSGGTVKTADRTFSTARNPHTQPPVLGPIAIVPSAFRRRGPRREHRHQPRDRRNRHLHGHTAVDHRPRRATGTPRNHPARSVRAATQAPPPQTGARLHPLRARWRLHPHRRCWTQPLPFHRPRPQPQACARTLPARRYTERKRKDRNKGRRSLPHPPIAHSNTAQAPTVSLCANNRAPKRPGLTSEVCRCPTFWDLPDVLGKR